MIAKNNAISLLSFSHPEASHLHCASQSDREKAMSLTPRSSPFRMKATQLSSKSALEYQPSHALGLSEPAFAACGSAEQQHQHCRMKTHTFTSAPGAHPAQNGGKERSEAYGFSRISGTSECGTVRSNSSASPCSDETPVGSDAASPANTGDDGRFSTRTDSPPPGGTSLRFASLESSKTFSHLAEDRSCSPQLVEAQRAAVTSLDQAEPPRAKRRGKKSAAALEAERREKKNNRERQRRQEVNDAFDELTRLLHVKRAHKSDKVTVLQAAVQALQATEASLGPELFGKIRRGEAPAVVPAPAAASLRQMSAPLPQTKQLSHPQTQNAQQRGTKRPRRDSDSSALHVRGPGAGVAPSQLQPSAPPPCTPQATAAQHSMQAGTLHAAQHALSTAVPVPDALAGEGSGQGGDTRTAAPAYPVSAFLAGQLSMEDDMDEDDGIPWDFESLGLGPPPGDGFSHLFLLPEPRAAGRSHADFASH